MHNHIKLLKDKLLRKKYNKYEKKIKLYKFLIESESININKRYIIGLNYCNHYKNKKYYISKIKNYCIYSGRSRGILSKFKISRHLFKKLATKGYISEIFKK